MGQNGDQFTDALEINSIQGWLGLWAKRLAYRMPRLFTFEDAKQEITLTVYERYLRYYKPNRGSIEGFIASTIEQAHHTIVKYYTRQRRGAEIVGMPYEGLVVDETDYNSESKLQVMFIETDLERWKMHDSMEVVQTMKCGYNMKETARMLGISRETVRRRLKKVERAYEQD